MEPEIKIDRPGKITAWKEALRPRTLPVSMAGVIAGAACGIFIESFRWLPVVICFLFALLAQIVSNLANEYYDYKNGLDKKGREGFRRGVTEGDISPVAMKKVFLTLLAIDCLLGCTLIYWGGVILIPVGILIALFALAYSTGPYPLSHHGLGDIAVVIFFGLVPVYFTAYVQAPEAALAPLCIPIGLATGLLAANVLIVNNYRDADDDKEVGKHTTAVIFGRKVMGIVYMLNFTIAMVLLWFSTKDYLSPIYGIIWIGFEGLYLTLWIGLLPLRGSALNPVLKRTAQLMLAVCTILLLTSIFCK